MESKDEQKQCDAVGKNGKQEKHPKRQPRNRAKYRWEVGTREKWHWSPVEKRVELQLLRKEVYYIKTYKTGFQPDNITYIVLNP